jgi:hypothetical protein
VFIIKKEYVKLIEDLLQDFKVNNYLDASHIPKIDLYMDQVTTFMDEHLDLFKRNDEDKTLTKTMINNYSKFHLLPPTAKKKYSRDHMLMLLFIFYLKPTLSIPDIGAILMPLQKILSKDSTDLSLEDFYNTLAKAQFDHFDVFSEQIQETVKISQSLFSDSTTKNSEGLSLIATIYMLSLQASLQKNLVAHLIDNYLKPIEVTKEKEPKKAEKKEKPKKPHNI